jgi:uncharacterized membrane protein YdjX (TVP38/TMEM64 family)
VRLLLDQQFIVMKLRMSGGWGVCLFIGAHVVATTVGLPGTVLVVAGGAVFGILWGTVWSVMGATLGAIAAFSLARFLLRDWVERCWGHHAAFKKLTGMLQGNMFQSVLTIRFTPISPFNLVNFLLGITPIRLSSYAAGTLIGIVPGTAVYTWLGASGAKALHGEGYLSLVLALGVLGLLSLLPIWWKRLKAR